MDSKWPCFFSILHIFFSSVQLCEIPGGNVQPIRSLNVELLRLTEDVSEEPNPSLYLGLRLSDRHDLEKESRYLERLKDAFRPNASSPSEAVHYQEQPGTGGLALYLLALRAACHNMETPEGNRLITQLKLHLHKEKLKIGHASDGYPITNYYQYSLGVLALCTHEKKIDEHVIHKLLHAEKHGLFRHNSDISVDTEAMAGLAFACLQQQTLFYTPELLAKLNHSLQRVTEKILRAQTSGGAFGNIYSSPLAVQFLIATRTHQKKPECPAAVAALFQSLEQGGFRNTLIKSQLLPVFYGKSYLDIAHKECQTERGGAEESLVLAAPTPASRKANPQRRIGVQLVVKRPPQRDYLYKQVLYVPFGSSLLDVLKAAEKQTRVPFTFETQNSLSGPMLTGVMGIKAEEGERKYWKILRAPHSVLDEGTLLQDERLDSLRLLCLTSFPSFCILFVAALVLEVAPAWDGTLASGGGLWACLLLSCLGSVLYNLASFSVISLTSALTIHVLGNFNVVGNLVLSRVLFGSHLTVLGYAGVALTLSGVFMYHHCERLAACWCARWARREKEE